MIRPCKGLEPHLYECLAATFRQTYPSNKLNIRFCVASRDDPAYPILQQLVTDFPSFDVKVLVEADDPVLHGPDASLKLGPNPKISNMTRAYREAKGDLIWVIDCNVWVGSGVLGRMVDTLCGYTSQGQGKKYKFVHQLPLGVDLTNLNPSSDASSVSLTGETSDGQQVLSASTSTSRTLSPADLQHSSHFTRILRLGGGRLEELFLSSSHAKFYTAINTVLIAPCIVGKSNMFRKSHLDSLTSENTSARPPGIDYFSYNICEDHLIGDLLWRGQVPEERGQDAEQLGKHCMVFGDLAIQPMAGMSVPDYAARRVRWLRVRKFTVTVATLVEPGTESFLCSAYGAWGVTTVPFFFDHFGIPHTWAAFTAFWLLSVAGWALVDWTQYQTLHKMACVEVDEHTPSFARGRRSGHKRTFWEWLASWLGREVMALPIWTWAIYGGITVNWRGKMFKVGMDMQVHSVDEPLSTALLGGDSNGKRRRE